jgi:hypothetical protein
MGCRVKPPTKLCLDGWSVIRAGDFTELIKLELNCSELISIDFSLVRVCSIVVRGHSTGS